MNCYFQYIDYHYHYLIGAGFPFNLRDHLEKIEHHPHVMGCDTLTLKNIRLSNIHQTTNTLIARRCLRIPNCAW